MATASRTRWLWAGAAAVVAAGVIAALVVAARDDGGEASGGPGGGAAPTTAPTTGPTPGTSTTGPRPGSPEAAIAAWLPDHLEEVLPGYDGDYLGRCWDWGAEIPVGSCSIPRDDLGERRIESVGVAATDWGGDLLLQRADDGWEVVDVWRWPEPGSGSFGSPWSPFTPIAAWWAANGPARYGQPVASLGDCATATDAGVSEQTLVCADLVDASAGRRVYRSGPLPDRYEVYLLLAEQPDHSWVVTATAPYRDAAGAELPPPW